MSFFRLKLIGVVIIATLISPHLCFAHRVNIFCWVEGGKIFCDSKYPSGEKVKKGKVNLIDMTTHQTIASKITDNQGKVEFPVTSQMLKNKHDIQAEILAGMGHRNTWKISYSELSSSGEQEQTTTNTETNFLADQEKPNDSVLPWDQSPTPAKVKGSSTTAPACSPTQLKRLMEKTLDKKLNPILEKLTLLQERKITFYDVFAGIGYILGLMGIAMYFLSKNKQS